ncbi:MAG TPA: transglutaminase domain-containing protein [Puia sp.]|nr:transglutaminase domain-containing protein [Puia sp.]
MIVISLHCAAQESVSLSKIDSRVQFVDPAPPAELAQRLVAGYPSETERVRAIFSWIAEHIVYRTKRTSIKPGVTSNKYLLKPIDSVTVYSANDYVAESVIRTQLAVCEGFARLFKTLCDYAGIKCVLVTGYARADPIHLGKRFFSNHYWNAVFADSAWRLVDVTWGSGYFTYYGDEYIKHFDDYYFFTPPELFARDHFPDDLQWTLLPEPPVPDEFYQSVFKQRSYVKYDIVFFSPTRGMLHANVGDTLRFSVQVGNAEKDRAKISDTAAIDSNMMTKYSSTCFLEPAIIGNLARYEYVVSSDNIKWIHLMYNHDVILRYRLDIKIRDHQTSAASNSK